MVFMPKPEKKNWMKTLFITASSFKLQSSKAMNLTLKAGVLTTPKVSSSHLTPGINSDID